MLSANYHTNYIEELYLHVEEVPTHDHIDKPYTKVVIGDLTWFPSEAQVIELARKLFDYTLARREDGPTTPQHSVSKADVAVGVPQARPWKCPNDCGCRWQEHDLQGCCYCSNCWFSAKEGEGWMCAQ